MRAFSYSVGEPKLMNHFVVRTCFPLIAALLLVRLW